MASAFLTYDSLPVLGGRIYSVAMRNHFIKQWRKYRGLTQQQLADRMEEAPGIPLLTNVSLSRIERGQQPYSEPVLHALAQALSCEPADLIAVNPLIESDVVDFLAYIRTLDPQTRARVMAVARAAGN